MALDPIKLDDLTWNEMVVAIRQRIATASAGNWTLHAPVDPGVTLLELFAYLLEQRLYWMDQVPDSRTCGALALLGAQPRPTRAAATVMYFPEIDQATVLAKGTGLTLELSEPPLIFSAEREIALLPLPQTGELISLFIDGEDRTPDLLHGIVLRLFPSGGSGDVKIVVRVAGLLPPKINGKYLSLLFDLRDPGGIAPEWAPQWNSDFQRDRGDDPNVATQAEGNPAQGEPNTEASIPPPAEISWSYSGAGGKRIPFAPGEVVDGTGGLRRSGVVLLPIRVGTDNNIDWQPEPSDDESETHAYALWMRVDEATFSAPPRLERLIPNVVIASHQRETREHQLTREFPPLSGNVISLADLSEEDLVDAHPPIEDTIKLSIREADDKWHSWRTTSDLSFHGPSDRVFIANRVLGEISFGDGLTGRLPIVKNDSQPQFKVKYCFGGGTAGNLGLGNWKTSRLPELNDVRLAAVNVVQTAGGEEPETMEAARERAATELKQRTRAVIREDYEEIARTIPGIAIKRAHAAIGLHPNYPWALIPGAVTVFVVPDVSRPDVLSEDSPEFEGAIVESAFVAAPVPDPGALATVRAKLEVARLAGNEVFVSAPLYRPVDLTLEIESNSTEATELSQKIRRRLRSFLDPLIGGDAGDGWPFGEPLRPSAILREAQAALGTQGRLLQIFIDLAPTTTPPKGTDFPDQKKPDCSPWPQAEKENGSQQNDPTCADVAIGAHDLVELRRLTINFHRAQESGGGLR
ncbi:MAG TPA: baseplate J/gp47 family protein [Pyrinomonadaceae bacterium]|nr:baseplate J/gp47 family protein [Pyrinomonadaceae bacterium]